jgi:molybdenum cofactor cytidylyltransferase
MPPDVEAVLIVLGDQPTIESNVFDRLVDAWTRGGRPIVAPRYSGRRGNPVLFDRTFFDELRALDGDRGARDLIDAQLAQLEVIEVPDVSPLDVDTPADYDALLRQRRARR